MIDVRTGVGYDIHRFAEGRPLVLGGVAVPAELGLDGHSDADVLLHAIADALLGAVAEGDIGDHFPPSDTSIAGIASGVIVTRAREIVVEQGFAISNVDATVIAETPKISAYRLAMRTEIATLLEISLNRVSLKATTNERLGAIGRSEGIAALAVATLIRSTEDDR